MYKIKITFIDNKIYYITKTNDDIILKLEEKENNSTKFKSLRLAYLFLCDIIDDLTEMANFNSDNEFYKIEITK